MKNFRKKVVLLLTGIAIITAAVWGYFHFRNRDERLLRAMVAELEIMVSKRPGKSNALSLLDAATPERVFASKVKIVSDLPKTGREFTLKDLSQMLVMMKKNCRSAELNMEIEKISVNKENAVLQANGMFSGSGSGGSFREVRDVELDCQKLNGKWKISGVKLKAVIKR